MYDSPATKLPFLEFIRKLTECKLLTLVVSAEQQIKSPELITDPRLNYVFVSKLEGKDAAGYFLSEIEGNAIDKDDMVNLIMLKPKGPF